jgi:hypothetical protein
MDDILTEIMSKIDEGSVNTTDFNRLISESNEKSIRARVHRKMSRNPLERHIDNPTGKSPFSSGKFSVAERTHPKLKPNGQMGHGDADAAHKRSTKTQRKTQRKKAQGMRPVRIMGKPNG